MKKNKKNILKKIKEFLPIVIFISNSFATLYYFKIIFF